MKILSFLFVVMILSTASSCKKCKEEDPRARVVNNGTDKVSVQIMTSGGNTVNINNIEPSASSSYSSFAPGEVTFTVKVSGADYVKTVVMDYCFDYDIAIDKNNVITSQATDRND